MNDAIRRLDEAMARLPFDPAALEAVLTAQGGFYSKLYNAQFGL